MKKVCLTIVFSCLFFSLFAQALPGRGLYTMRSYGRGSYLYQKTTGEPYLRYDAPDADLPNAVWEFIPVGYDGAYNIRNLHTGQYIGISMATLTDSPENIAKWEMEYGDWYSSLVEPPFIKMFGTRDYLSCGDFNGIVFLYPRNDFSRYHLEEVSSLSHTLRVGSMGWATLVLAFNAVIPEADGFRAYVVDSVEGGRVKLKEVSGLLPANTAIVVNAPEGDYDFFYSPDDSDIDVKSEMKGTFVDKDVVPGGVAYVLSLVGGEPCFCKVLLNRNGGKAFKNNANKGYLDVRGASPANSLRVDMAGAATSIAGKCAATYDDEVYDLSGNRVVRIDAPGIYVVNGLKMLVR